MAEFKVWLPDEGETEADATIAVADSAEEAAKSMAMHLMYDEMLRVGVRSPDGRVSFWIITVSVSACEENEDV